MAAEKGSHHKKAPRSGVKGTKKKKSKWGAGTLPRK